MNKALILEDDTFSVVLIEGEKTYTSLGKFIKKLATDRNVWHVQYLNLTKEGLIPLKNLSSLLNADVVKFNHLEKYAKSIENFIN